MINSLHFQSSLIIIAKKISSLNADFVSDIINYTIYLTIILILHLYTNFRTLHISGLFLEYSLWKIYIYSKQMYHICYIMHVIPLHLSKSCLEVISLVEMPFCMMYKTASICAWYMQWRWSHILSFLE